MGTLAAGIAHEFNNILWIINGNTELAASSISKDNPAHYHLEQIEDATLRAQDLVLQIINFTRPTEENREPLNIGIVIKEIIKLLRSSIPSTIRIHQHIPENQAP